MKFIDPNLGVPLPERDYGGNCLIYDPGNGTDPFHNIWVRCLYSVEIPQLILYLLKFGLFYNKGEQNVVGIY